MNSPIYKASKEGDDDNKSMPRTPVTSDLCRELREEFLQRRLLTTQNRSRVCSMLASNSRRQPKSSLFEANTLKSDDARLRIIREIKSTEITYLDHLHLLIKYFMIPLKYNSIIDKSSHRKLFSHVEMIFNMNQEFLRQLEDNLENVAEAFLQMAPCFKLYSVYAFDYRNALLLVQKLTAENAAFRTFIANTESRPEIQRKLNSLMIVPIQRLPRYKLLLDQILLHTSPADRDYKTLKECIKKIEDTISYIDTCIKNQEVLQMLINIQNSLYNCTPNIVCPSRRVIKEGILGKITRNGKSIRRYCILMSDIFMYCKILKEREPNTLIENSLDCCCIFPLKTCSVYELFPGNFKITCQGDGIIFAEKDLHECNLWVQSIRDAISLHIQHRQTLRKESSKRKPLRKNATKLFGEESIIIEKNTKNAYTKVFRNKNRPIKNTDNDDDDDDDDSDEENKKQRFSGGYLNSLKRNLNALYNTLLPGTRDTSKCVNTSGNMYTSSPLVMNSANKSDVRPSPMKRNLNESKNYTSIHRPGNHLNMNKHFLSRERLNIDDEVPSPSNTRFETNGSSEEGMYYRKSNLTKSSLKRTLLLQDGRSSQAPAKKRVKFANISIKSIEESQSYPFEFSKQNETSSCLTHRIQNFFSKLFYKT